MTHANPVIGGADACMNGTELYILFNSTLGMSKHWYDDNERMCVTEP